MPTPCPCEGISENLRSSSVSVHREHVSSAFELGLCQLVAAFSLPEECEHESIRQSLGDFVLAACGCPKHACRVLHAIVEASANNTGHVTHTAKAMIDKGGLVAVVSGGLLCSRVGEHGFDDTLPPWDRTSAILVSFLDRLARNTGGAIASLPSGAAYERQLCCALASVILGGCLREQAGGGAIDWSSLGTILTRMAGRGMSAVFTASLVEEAMSLLTVSSQVPQLCNGEAEVPSTPSTLCMGDEIKPAMQKQDETAPQCAMREAWPKDDFLATTAPHSPAPRMQFQAQRMLAVRSGVTRALDCLARAVTVSSALTGARLLYAACRAVLVSTATWVLREPQVSSEFAQGWGCNDPGAADNLADSVAGSHVTPQAAFARAAAINATSEALVAGGTVLPFASRLAAALHALLGPAAAYVNAICGDFSPGGSTPLPVTVEGGFQSLVEQPWVATPSSQPHWWLLVTRYATLLQVRRLCQLSISGSVWYP